jgi:hypothetical protein
LASSSTCSLSPARFASSANSLPIGWPRELLPSQHDTRAPRRPVDDTTGACRSDLRHATDCDCD